jgi:hypothetical protein
VIDQDFAPGAVQAKVRELVVVLKTDGLATKTGQVGKGAATGGAVLPTIAEELLHPV